MIIACVAYDLFPGFVYINLEPVLRDLPQGGAPSVVAYLKWFVTNQAFYFFVHISSHLHYLYVTCYLHISWRVYIDFDELKNYTINT